MRPSLTCLFVGAILFSASSAAAQPAGKLLLETRLRYETVDQAGLAQTAQAITLRNRLGWESPEVNGLKGLVEIEDVRRLGAEHYNIATPTRSLNGKTRYPAINDEEITELNRAQLAWKVSPALTLIAGRQRLIIDDQRFVGSPPWRQNEQTFDALKADWARGKISATYVYIARVNRNLDQDYRSDSHGLNLAYAVSDPLKLQAFAYALDFGNSPVSSNKTYGAKASGAVKLDAVQLSYAATLAHQTDYRGNSAPFSLDYRGGAVTAAYDIWSGRVSYEVFEGDGVRGFATPISTNHPVQGWADAFSAVGGAKTFVDGLEDFNLQAVARPKWRLGPAANPQFTVRRHDFDNQRFGADLAREWDAEALVAVGKSLTLGVQYADFQAAATRPAGAAAPPASRTKLIFSLEYRR